MKARYILYFITAILIALFILTISFPRKGINIAGVQLRFPSLEKILTRKTVEEPEIPDLEEPVFTAQDSIRLSLQDTLNYYRELVENQLGKFYFPYDDVGYFDGFFEQIQTAKSLQKVIRILHYGDSQIELDRISFNLRKYFQEKFGGGGPGLLPAVQTIPTATVYQRWSGDYTTYSAYGDGNRRKNGNYGFFCKCIGMTGENRFFVKASQNLDVPHKMRTFSKIKLYFFNKNGDFSALLSDNLKKEKETLVANSEGLQSFLWELDTPLTTFTLTLKGNADIYGISVDGKYGVSVDNIPLRGSAGTLFTQLNDSLTRQMFQESNVGLVILQFGGNAVPAISSQKSIGFYVNNLQRQIQFFKRINPQGKILLIGPSDMAKRVEGELRSYPLLGQLVEAMKKMANDNGVAFWDIYEVMGGENSMIAWYKHGLAGEDLIHFTPKGANRIGEILVNSFDNLYQLYLSKQNLSTQNSTVQP